MTDPLFETAHRPYPLPTGRWLMRQRWRNLLFAHWPVPPSAIAERLPADLEVDTYDGSAWLGVVPFSMERLRVRAAGELTFGVPTTRAFPELNLRTYVRSRRTGKPGVWFFSLDAGSTLAVLGARLGFSLPYFPSRMQSESMPGGDILYRSRRWWPRDRPAETVVRYRPTGAVQHSERGSLAAFLTERYCLYTVSRWSGRLMRGEIHHRPWPLQPAEAAWTANGLPADFRFHLPRLPPVLQFSATLDVVIWALRPDRA